MSIGNELRDIRNRLYAMSGAVSEGLTEQDMRERLRVIQSACGILGNRIGTIEETAITEPMRIDLDFGLRHRTFTDLLRTLAAQQMEIEPLEVMLAWRLRSAPHDIAPTHEEVRRHWERGDGRDECWFTAEDGIERRHFLKAYWHPVWTGKEKSIRFVRDGYDIDPQRYKRWIACAPDGEPQPWPSQKIDPIPDPAPGFCLMGDRYVDLLEKYGL